MCREDHLVQPSPRFLFLSLALSSLSFLSACSLALDFSKFREGCPEGEEMVNGTCEPIPDVIAELLEQSRFDEAEQTEFTPPAAGESLVFTGLIGEAPYKESTFTFRARAGQWLTIEAFARDQLVPKFRVKRVGDSGKWRESPVDPSMRKSERKLLILQDGDYELHLSPSHWHAEGEGGRFIVRMTQLVPPAPQPYEGHQGDLLELEANFFVLDYGDVENVLDVLVEKLRGSADAALIAWHEGFTDVRILPLLPNQRASLAPNDGRTYLLVDYFTAVPSQTEYALGEFRVYCDAVSGEFGGGAGTPEDPYLICTPDHLLAIDSDLTAHYLLTRHLHMGGVNFIPIGLGDADGFSGGFDGGGYSISNLANPDPNFERVGLFATVAQNAIVKNLVLRSSVLFGEGHVGSIAGINRGMISRVGVIEGKVFATLYHGGGLVGTLAGSGMIKESFYVGTIGGDTNIGGIVGSAEGSGNATVQDCYAVPQEIAVGDPTGFGGGIAGNLRSNQGKVVRSYVLPTPDFSITGTVNTIAGNAQNAAIDHCYFASAASYTGSLQGVGLTAENLGRSGSYEGWDFAQTWYIDEGAEPHARPRLQFERELKP